MPVNLAEPGQVVTLDRRDEVTWITIRRPKTGNGIDVATARALMDAALEVDEDEAVRAVVLTGEGRLFCGGGDVQAFAEPGVSASAAIKAITGALHVAIARFARMKKPLITMINGPAAGAGLSLALLGDIAIAARSAHFTSAYTAIGLTPDGGLTWLLPRFIGLRRAQDMIFSNRRLTAEEAVEWGLISRVVDDAALAATVAEAAGALAQSATSALGTARQLLLTGFANGLETQMELEARAISAAAGGAEGREGISAFLAKRRPAF